MSEAPVAQKLQIVVVPHTHWDREWYLPFEQFRLRLVRLIDRLLAIFERDPRYTHFMLDGQTVVLEDYMEIRPEAEPRLKALVSSGQVAVGPWYVLPDEFLVSGEAIVRNLQVGLAMARRFGQAMELGYLPDSFGHLAQMPQIMAGFGFTAGALWRGVGDDNPGAEWEWEALDGTRIYLQWLVGGYGNFANLPEDPQAALERLAEAVAQQQAIARSRTVLLMNGSDHLMPQAHLPALIAAFNEANPDWEVVQAPLKEAIARARAQAGELPVVKGELRQAAATSLLPGVLSARTYLKLENARAQTLLERWVEPMSALAAMRGHPYPAAPLRHAWKLLLQNHPHDSICGCSVDSVHRQMMTRFEGVDQLGRTLRHEAFAVLSGEDPEAELPRQAGLRLFNPHPWPTSGVVEAELDLDCEAEGVPVFSLIDEAELSVPYELVSLERGVRVVNRSPLYPYNVPVARVRLKLLASLPAFGSRTLKIAREPASQATHPELFAGSNWIENRFFKVRVIQGGVEIFDKTAEETIVHCFEDMGDRGDEYNFCPVEEETPVDSRAWHWDDWHIRSSGGLLTLSMTGTWRLPEGLAADRRRRVGSASLMMRVHATLAAGVRRVEFETTLVNRSRDHRFRAAFVLPGAIAQTHADTAFGWVTRSTEVPAKDWAETPMGTHPMVSQVLVDRPWEVAGVAAPGLHEYEAVDDTLFLTLVRAVGWLSRDDLSTRAGDAGPMLASPEAQCQGTYAFRYAWIAQDADEPVGTVARRGAEFAVPAIAFPLSTWPGHEEESLLAIDQPAWHFSALKRHETSDMLVLRLYNGAPQPREGTVTFGFPVKEVFRARLDETPGEAVTVSGGAIAARLGAYEIATFLIAPGA